jgi:hypothetical protein
MEHNGYKLNTKRYCIKLKHYRNSDIRNFLVSYATEKLIKRYSDLKVINFTNTLIVFTVDSISTKEIWVTLTYDKLADIVESVTPMATAILS